MVAVTYTKIVRYGLFEISKHEKMGDWRDERLKLLNRFLTVFIDI